MLLSKFQREINKIMVKQTEVEEWLQLPVTKEYFNKLMEEALVRRNIVANGGCIKTTAYETGEAYIKTLTQAEVYEICATPSVEDIMSLEEKINE